MVRVGQEEGIAHGPLDLRWMRLIAVASCLRTCEAFTTVRAVSQILILR